MIDLSLFDYVPLTPAQHASMAGVSDALETLTETFKLVVYDLAEAGAPTRYTFWADKLRDVGDVLNKEVPEGRLLDICADLLMEIHMRGNGVLRATQMHTPHGELPPGAVAYFAEESGVNGIIASLERWAHRGISLSERT